MREFIVILFCISSVRCQCGNFNFSLYYGDSMVLQRSPAQAVIWGYAESVGDTVVVSIANQIIATQAYQSDFDNVVWRAMLDAVNEDGPFTMTAISNGCTLTLKNVLFGDVWFCSGQSNMVHPLGQIDDPEEELNDVENYPNIRTLRAPIFAPSDTPLEDLPSLGQPWTVPQMNATRIFSAVCWLFGKQLYEKYGRPVGLIQAAWGGTRIEAWSSPEDLEVCFPDGPSDGEGRNGASVLWNALVHPLLKLPIYGVLWYQGESNSFNPEPYGCAMSAMVKGWRRSWNEGTQGQTNPQFPFGQVQLAPNGENDREVGFPDIRWQQTREYGYTPNPLLNNVFTAVSVDLPDFDSPVGSLHPRYKRQIADRLFLGALPIAYEDTSEGRFQGPLPSSATLVGNELRITYDNNEALDIRTDQNFEICCAESEEIYCSVGEWTATAIVSSSVTGRVDLNVPCAEDEFVNGFRYAWRLSPCPLEECAVYSLENSLPAPPYTTNSLFRQGKVIQLS